MRKMFFLVLAAAAFLLMVPAQNAQAQGQSETPKVEIGAHYTFLRLRDFDTNDNGIGTRVTFNLADSFGIEGELNFFPQGRINFATLASANSRRTQGLFGVKYGMRSEKAGIYGKFRPGFMRFSEGDSIPGVSSSRTEFAFDFGGVFELYPTRHVALRFDVGDTVIRFSNPAIVTQPIYTNNLQIGTGIAFRF
jgi:hypothetical protein